MIEFTGPQSAPYQSYFLEYFLKFLNDSSPEVRQASSYGIGVAAQFGGAPFINFCISAVDPLFKALDMFPPIEGDEAILFARENIISAIGKICHYHSNSFNSESIIRKWIDQLPILKDDEEAVSTYSYLLDLVESHSPCVSSSTIKISSILMEVLVVSADLFTNQDELIKRIVRVSSSLLGNLDSDTRNKLWMTLDNGKQNKLKQYF